MHSGSVVMSADESDGESVGGSGSSGGEEGSHMDGDSTMDDGEGGYGSRRLSSKRRGMPGPPIGKEVVIKEVR